MRQSMTVAMILVLATGLIACTDSSSSGSDGASGSSSGSTTAVKVISTKIGCDVSVTEAPAGKVAFEVRNDGSQVTEFYLLAKDDDSIVGEVENIGPGITRTLNVTVEPGDYLTACKPGMKGDGIQAAFTVTAAQ